MYSGINYLMCLEKQLFSDVLEKQLFSDVLGETAVYLVQMLLHPEDEVSRFF